MIDEIRAFDPDFEIVVVDDGSHGRRPRPPPRRRGARRPAAVQPRHRRRRADRLPLRVRERASSSRCASTATASTTRPSSACSSAPVLADEADIVVGSRFAGGGGYRSSRSRRLGIRSSRGTVSLLRRPAGDRPDVGLPGAEPPRDRALRRRLPARLPRGRGGA